MSSGTNRSAAGPAPSPSRVSGSRPGSRKDDAENYEAMQRGVNKTKSAADRKSGKLLI